MYSTIWAVVSYLPFQWNFTCKNKEERCVKDSGVTDITYLWDGEDNGKRGSKKIELFNIGFVLKILRFLGAVMVSYVSV